MIRKVMTSSVLIAATLIGNLALAQGQNDPVVQQDDQVSGGKPTLQPEQPTLATAFMGRPLYSSQSPEADIIGNVNDLLISKDGTIAYAVVGGDGFLGLGERNIPVPFDDLEVLEGEAGIRLIYAATRQDLEAAQEFGR